MSALDYDVLVIGAGPAGIAAAMRARWVKRYTVVPCNVALIDPATPGGLTQMGTCIMTSPGWIYNEETIRPFLVDDLSHFEVPHIRTRVVGIRRRESWFEVECQDGITRSARCVIVCSGMKMLVREPEFWNRGVTATSMGIEWVVAKLKHWVTDPKLKRIVFVGSNKLTNLMPLARKFRAPHVDLRFVIESIAGQASHCEESGADVLFGTVVEMTGDERLRAIAVEHPIERSTTRIDDIDLLVIDFLSYEVSPARNFACAGAAVDEGGFIEVDRRQRTNVEGLFAAGDVTGMPACAGTAIGEGIVAGFEAYRYVYRQKFGSEPPLFAYYGRDAPLEEDFDELPPIPDTFGPRLIGSSQHVLQRVEERSNADERPLIVRTLDAMARCGHADIQQLAAFADLSSKQVAFAVRRLLEMKLITLSEVSS